VNGRCGSQNATVVKATGQTVSESDSSLLEFGSLLGEPEVAALDVVCNSLVLVVLIESHLFIILFIVYLITERLGS